MVEKVELIFDVIFSDKIIEPRYILFLSPSGNSAKCYVISWTTQWRLTRTLGDQNFVF